MVGSLLSNRPRVVDSNCRVSCLAFAFAADLALADSAVSLVKAASAGSGVSPPIGAASGSVCGAGSAVTAGAAWKRVPLLGLARKLVRVLPTALWNNSQRA